MKLTGIYGIQDALLAIVALSMQTTHSLRESKYELSLYIINHIIVKLAYNHSEWNITNYLQDNDGWSIGLI